MVCLGLKPGAADWKAQMNPLSHQNDLLMFNQPKWNLLQIVFYLPR